MDPFQRTSSRAFYRVWVEQISSGSFCLDLA